VLLVIGSPAGESLEQRRALGRMASSLANYTVITADNPGCEEAHDIAYKMERGFAPGAAYKIELDRAQAIEDVIQMAQPGDAVLIAGKGLEAHQEFSDTIVPFDDREFAKAALEMRGTALAKIIRTPDHGHAVSSEELMEAIA
jgi:UDP-N-acetylmuramyl tripeptide synthase